VDKLLLIDGNAILHRAYYALPDWRNRSGEATAGVYGFISMVLKAIEELKPSHLIVVFDTPEPTFRHLLYVGYQTTREKERQVSEDIWGQVEKLKIVFEKMGVPVFSLPGFEADDVIGALAVQSKSDEVIIITGDKDLMQLVNEKVKLFMPQKGLSDGIIVDESVVMEKMGVHPMQIIDYKGLVGDASDNYPGVSGIGPKTAVHLLAEYGTLDNIYKKLKAIDEKIKVKLTDGYEAALLSQKLATIKLDVPVTLQINKAKAPDKEKMLAILKELGYKSLAKRVGGGEKDMQEIDDKQEKLFEI
jgi:DNA polymerase I